jgi:hypothetical protein
MAATTGQVMQQGNLGCERGRGAKVARCQLTCTVRRRALVAGCAAVHLINTQQQAAKPMRVHEAVSNRTLSRGPLAIRERGTGLNFSTYERELRGVGGRILQRVSLFQHKMKTL